MTRASQVQGNLLRNDSTEHVTAYILSYIDTLVPDASVLLSWMKAGLSQIVEGFPVKKRTFDLSYL